MVTPVPKRAGLDRLIGARRPPVGGALSRSKQILNRKGTKDAKVLKV